MQAAVKRRLQIRWSELQTAHLAFAKNVMTKLIRAGFRPTHAPCCASIANRPMNICLRSHFVMRSASLKSLPVCLIKKGRPHESICIIFSAHSSHPILVLSPLQLISYGAHGFTLLHELPMGRSCRSHAGAVTKCLSF